MNTQKKHLKWGIALNSFLVAKENAFPRVYVEHLLERTFVNIHRQATDFVARFPKNKIKIDKRKTLMDSNAGLQI